MPCRTVTKRRSSWACIGNPNPEQETIKGTHAQETSAYMPCRHMEPLFTPPTGQLIAANQTLVIVN